jgi:hypothetical protein
MDGSAHVKLASPVSADDGQKTPRAQAFSICPRLLFVQIVY